MLDESREEVNDDLRLNVEPVLHAPLCAWCLSEQGIPAGEGSHGMCEKHQAVMMQQYQEIVAARVAARS